MSRDDQTLFEAGPKKFLQRFVTLDKTWVHHLQPESQQSKQWKNMKAKIITSAGKVIASIFWDAGCVSSWSTPKSPNHYTPVHNQSLRMWLWTPSAPTSLSTSGSVKHDESSSQTSFDSQYYAIAAGENFFNSQERDWDKIPSTSLEKVYQWDLGYVEKNSNVFR